MSSLNQHLPAGLYYYRLIFAKKISIQPKSGETQIQHSDECIRFVAKQ